MPVSKKLPENASSGDSIRNPGLALVVGLLILAGLLLGASGTLPTGDVVVEIGESKMSEGKSMVRVLVSPRSQIGHRHIRSNGRVNIKHDWKGRFSADVLESDIPTLLLDADVVPVELLELHDKTDRLAPLRRAVCGDKVCQGKEKFTCPSDCQPSSVRTCKPSTQRDYNVVQVGGGKIGAGEGVNVAVLDTGSTPTHLDLKANIKLCVDTTRVGIQSGCQDTDTVAHGTHTTGIVAANGGPDGLGIFGVSPGGNLLVMKVCGGSSCYADDITEAIDYAAQSGAHIVSMSFGGASESALIRDAILRHPDILFVASAGNSGPAENTINYPAAHAAVVAVAAHDQNKVVTWFSSRGINDGYNNVISAREVEVSAGGLNVEAPNSDGCYSRLSGTSFSAPTIAGLAAVVWDSADGVVDGIGDASSVRRYLILKSQDITLADGGGASAGYDIASGYGMPSLS